MISGFENQIYTWNIPTKIYFGANASVNLAQSCLSLKTNRPLIVCDAFLKSIDSIAKIIDSLKQDNIHPTVFSDFKSNPTSTQVNNGKKIYENNQCDCIITIGGGSAIDTGKAIALMINQVLPLSSFEDIGDNFKQAQLPIPPLIALPTTAGTGSEVGRASVIYDEEEKRKIILFHPDLLPKVVLADPNLTLELPENLTAATGMDALSHCLEAFCVNTFHPTADGIALEGIRLIDRWLPIAYQEGSNLKARQNMLAASQMGAIAFQKGLGAMHALSHAIGAYYDAHHGLINAILMPYVVSFNQNTIQDKCRRLVDYCGLKTNVLDWILAMREQLNIPANLKEIGISSVESQLINIALKDPSCQGNPILLNHENLHILMEQAIQGYI